LDPTARFTDCVGAYVAARPGYPAALAPLLVRELGLPPRASVADIGCGTGLSSQPFIAAGLEVVGIEPNAPMRAAADAMFLRAPNFRSLPGSAEDTGLPDAAVDLAVAGQAFHWFDHARFAAELRRVLRPGGALALFWNSRRHDASDFMAEYNALLLTYSAEYRDKWKGDDVGAKHAPAMAQVFGAAGWREAELPNTQQLDRAGLIARVESDSYAPKPGDPLHAPMVQALSLLFDRHQRDGRVRFVYRCRIFFGPLNTARGPGT
jgi:SAM-dependent methyltransferase